MTHTAHVLRCARFRDVTACGSVVVQAGFQEKAAFLQAFGGKGVWSGFLVLPVLSALLLVAAGVLVMWQHSSPAEHSPKETSYRAVTSIDGEEGDDGLGDRA
jgi:hypothetical protein